VRLGATTTAHKLGASTTAHRVFATIHGAHG
jgi:hypothetical protein